MIFIPLSRADFKQVCVLEGHYFDILIEYVVYLFRLSD